MAQITITSDGTYILKEPNSNVRPSVATTILVRENTDGATLLFGYGDADNNFVPFEDGTIEIDNIIYHGVGCKLMVSVTGIITGTVNIYFFAS
jgi:hypothetical protein